jgi:hypothetical protein
MTSKVLQTTLLLTCLACSVAIAKPKYNKFNRLNKYKTTSSDLLDRTRIAIEFGGGIPVGLISQGRINQTTSKYTYLIRLSMIPSINLGFIISYPFPVNSIYSIGPDIGMLWSFAKRTWSLKGVKHEIKNIEKDTYMSIPLYMRFNIAHHQRFFLSSNIICGYDLTIFLNSTEQITGYDSHTNETFLKVTDKYEVTPNRPRLTPGSIVLGYELEFPKGFYLAGKFKFPILLLEHLLQEGQENATSNTDLEDVKEYMLLALNEGELSIGADIMKWID